MYRNHGEPAEIKTILSLCKTWFEVLIFSIHFWGTSSLSVPYQWRDILLFNGFYYHFHSKYPMYRSHGEPVEIKTILSMCKTWFKVLRISIHCWGTSSISITYQWRDILLFNGFYYRIHSKYPMYRSHGEPAEIKTILSLCKTWFEVLKISIHFWGTSSLSVPYQWRDILLFNGFYYRFRSKYPMYQSHGEPAEIKTILSLRKTWFEVLTISIHFWGISSLSVPYQWRDILLFNGFYFRFHSKYPMYRSHGEPVEIKTILSMCKTWFEVLKISIHFWGTSSISVPIQWRDILLFNGFYYRFHSKYPMYRNHGEPA